MGAFKTKARAVELLGRKQIRDSVTALSEIMKNAYDADAKLLRVEFLTKDTRNPCIVICDTGSGMDQYDLENKWLVLGTPSKLGKKEQVTPGGRPLMGAKGIGRLAISRLGQQMWMFTKKVDSEWNILYINWNIFENPELYIEDINIPVVYDKKLVEIPQEIAKLKSIQLENLNNFAWNTSKNLSTKEKIARQIRSSELDQDLVDDFCNIIEMSDIRQGTIIFSLDLNDDWDRYLDPDATTDDDMLAVRNYNRLNSFMTDFGKNESDFQVEVFYNGNPLVFSTGFTEEDYEIYDLRISGYVEHGMFKGKIDARNADRTILNRCNQILLHGIPVTSGIKNWEQDDCGKYWVKLCHFEMNKKNTGLTDEELETVKRRMEKAGGIGVYRDNVRVLPYGEPDKDFLELEERRSRSAKYYLFSHRNMFGRIDITSSENPNLEDKSSREGFIENQYYNYFIRTLQNLLIKISVDFVGDMNKKSLMLRQSYLKNNNAKHQEKEKLREFEKEQQRLFKDDKVRINDALKRNPFRLREFEMDFEKNLQQLNKIKDCDFTRYKELLDNESKIKAFRYERKESIARIKEELYIYMDERFEGQYDSVVLDKVAEFNEHLEETIGKIDSQLIADCDTLTKINQLKISEYQVEIKKRTGHSMEEVRNDLNEHLKKKKSLLKTITENARKNVKLKSESLNGKMNRIIDYGADIRGFERESDEAIGNDLLSRENELQVISKIISDPGWPDELLKVQERLGKSEEEIYNAAERIAKKIENRYCELNKKLERILARFEEDNSDFILQLTVRYNELKELNDTYADLANLGMAAEIVSHEMNQLFNNVYDAINQLRLHGVSQEDKYYLHQIDIGFRAISDRLSQMSPMYRSKNTYKKNVNMHDVLEEQRRFFENRLQKQNVHFINDVPRDLVLKISLSKIYPVLSNLIYNSLYWVADRKHKEILFRYVREENAMYVEDSGEGIAVRNKERIFDPFFSLKKDGRGLGLTISKNVLLSQGYDICVVTDSDKKYLSGACFKITFGSEAEV